MVCGEEFFTELIYCRYFSTACFIPAGSQMSLSH
jgi:hypothetical protein